MIPWPKTSRSVAANTVALSTATTPFTRVGLEGKAFAIHGRFFGAVEFSCDARTWFPLKPGVYGSTPKAGRGHRGLFLRRSPTANPGGVIVIASYETVSDAMIAAEAFGGNDAADQERLAPTRSLVTGSSLGAGALTQQTFTVNNGTRAVLVLNAGADVLWVSNTPTRATVSGNAVPLNPGESSVIVPEGGTFGYAKPAGAGLTFYTIEEIYE